MLGGRLILPGSVLVGFAEFFDRAYGDPRTARPYARVTPARIGGALLPFPCPHCKAVRPQVVAISERDKFCDAGRGFSWCPSCTKRYIVNWKGGELVDKIPAGAESAPARVVWGDGRTEVVRESPGDGLSLLGAL